MNISEILPYFCVPNVEIIDHDDREAISQALFLAVTLQAPHPIRRGNPGLTLHAVFDKWENLLSTRQPLLRGQTNEASGPGYDGQLVGMPS